jgi:hypothetical protein
VTDDCRRRARLAADENNLFLTFRQRQVTVWNFRGEQVTHFEDHTLWHPDTNTNNIFITAAQVRYVAVLPTSLARVRSPRGHVHVRAYVCICAQDFIISYCRPREGDGAGHGSVHISHILSGRCVAKLAISPEEEEGEERQLQQLGQLTMSGLGDVSALHFSEERNELLLGSRHGVLQVFAQ